MNPYIVGVAVLGAYGYATGRFTDFVDGFKKDKQNPSSPSRQIPPQPQQQQQPIIIQSQQARQSYLLPLGCASFISLAGYYYYIHSNGTKKVIGKVKETAKETQDVVTKCDENNIQRFKKLDDRNEARATDLETNIRTEQRSGFHVISEQLYGLTQVCIQTLSVIANGDENNQEIDNNNVQTMQSNHNNEKLNLYIDKAQQMADTILSDEHAVGIREQNLKDVKAEIQQRTNNNQINDEQILISSNTTPGGPPPNTNNPFDVNRNQSAYITNISYKDNINDEEKENKENESNGSIFNAITNKITPFKIIFNNTKNTKDIVVYSVGGMSVVVLSLWMINKLRSKGNSNHQVMVQ